MRRCQHFCGCEGNPVGRVPNTGLLLCAGCPARSILGADSSRAGKYFGHVPAHVPAEFGEPGWTEPLPLRAGDQSPLSAYFEPFLTIRADFGSPLWDFMPLTRAAEPLGALPLAGVVAASNPQRPPKDPPSGPLPPPPARPIQPNPPRR